MRRALVLASAVLLVPAACGGPPDAGDFREEAEGFIEDEDSELTARFGGPFTDATCEEPADSAIGTRFTCTATDPTGAVVQFPVEIVGENEIAVEGPTAGTAPAGTTPAGSVAPATTVAG